MPDRSNLTVSTDGETSALSTQKWGAIACFLLAVASILAPLIYLVGNLQDPLGPFTYVVADFLSGPVWAASLIMIVFTLREQMGERAPRRMSLALLAAALSAGAMVAVACIRFSNRHYHLIHPELHLESSATVLIVWTTLVAGLTGAGWHFLGWGVMLVGSAGWTSGRVPCLLCVLYLAAGTMALVVFVLPEGEANAAVLAVVVSFWQGILLWKTAQAETLAPAINSSQLDRA